MDACRLFQHGQRRRHAAGGAIGAMIGHGIDRIGNGQNARFQQHVVARQAPRISRTVQPLMVLAHDRGHQLRKVDSCQRSMASLDMQLHKIMFQRG